jgi:RNase P/RNase MRP subunit p29
MLRFVSASLLTILVSTSVFAAEKTYQVTGPVLDVTDSTIVVDKNGERWEVSKDAASLVHGELKKGAKVTIKYKMVATDVEVKEGTTTKKKK